MKRLLLGIFTALAIPAAALADPAYFIAQIQVDDWDKFVNDYGNAAIPTLIEHEAKVLVAGPQIEPLEGEWAGNHLVVIEFKDMDAAKAWYNSEDYQAAREIRLKHTSLNNLVFAPTTTMRAE